MLKIVNGIKKYKGAVVLNDVSLTFHDARTYGLTGENGSGKTMILKALSGYIQLDSGKVYQNHQEIRKDGRLIRNAGVLIEQPDFISNLSLLENLELIKAVCRNKRKIDLDDWIRLFSLEEFRNKKYSRLSLGTKQKMRIIQAFMDDPQVLLLDEITAALDEKSVSIVRALISEVQHKKLIVMTSHINEDITSLCDEVITIHEGKVLPE